jgi:osmotically-inducible protein OsmY
VSATDYVAGHVQEALAHNGETDVHVRADGRRLLLTGTVATDARRDTSARIASSLAEGLEVRNDITVLHCEAPGDDLEVLS